MVTASDLAPAAERSVANGANGDLLSATKASKLTGFNRNALVAACREDRVRCCVVHRPGLGRNGVVYRFDPRELEEDIAALPTCGYSGCERKAIGRSGGCEAHGHVLAGPRAAGVKRPDIGPKISAAKMGKPRPDLVEPMRARMTKYPAEERFCQYVDDEGNPCGKPLGTVLGWVIRAGGGRFCSGRHAQLWIWANVRGGRGGRVVICKCGETTRYLAPSQLGIVYCRHCFASHADTRAKRSEATRKALRRPVTKLRIRMARWGKLGDAYFDRAIAEFDRLRRGGAPKKIELHGRWLHMSQGQDAELEMLLSQQHLNRVRMIAWLDWQRHPKDWPRDKWPPSRSDPEEMEPKMLPAAYERVKKALQNLRKKPNFP